MQAVPRVTGYFDPRVGFRMHVVNTLIDLSCLRQFPLFVALCDHSQPTLRTDGQTDRRHARSTSTEMYAVSCQDESTCPISRSVAISFKIYCPGTRTITRTSVLTELLNTGPYKQVHLELSKN